MFCSASPVLRHTQDDVSQRGIFGTLLCTNFRVSFISDETPLEETVRMQDRASMTYCSLHSEMHLKEEFCHMIKMFLMMLGVGGCRWVVLLGVDVDWCWWVLMLIGVGGC